MNWNTKYKWVNTIKSSPNSKVLVMLSGGKDSIAALIMLKKHNIEVNAIHFKHKWSSPIPTVEAERICQKYQIPLMIEEYTKSMCEALKGYSAGRPCLICKKTMYKKLMQILHHSDYGWLCIGDNANDKTTIARIRQSFNINTEDDLVCSKYLGTEQGISLPKNIRVVRPLITMGISEIENFLSEEKEHVRQLNSTGDKYFEYHREGCPIQFADVGIEHTEELYDKLYSYNECITSFARKRKILASIHLPSTFIITIPTGYEEEAAIYLEKHGYPVNSIENNSELPIKKSYWATIYHMPKKFHDEAIHKKLFYRFLERLEITNGKQSMWRGENIVGLMYDNGDYNIHMHLNFVQKTIDIRYNCLQSSKSFHDKIFIDNLILELFRTRKFISYDIMAPDFKTTV